jgi:hypothetical protein
MARPSGATVVSALLVAVAFTLFVPILFGAATAVDPAGYEYGGSLSLVLENIPVLVAAGVLLILVFAMEAVSP